MEEHCSLACSQTHIQLSYTAQAYLPRDGTAMVGQTLLYQFVIKKILHRPI
ncbi:hypothetical protein I79_001815 [Cricetulus griseus]|uniref:Uncharacterized protein n=1 Tax=Cricetulus griseus TaxID=10029 RepID=G3GVR8_CRIGR|nr:hypothetical protein I79_001815 [Cricetulus griseus]